MGSFEMWQDTWNLSETGRRASIFVPQVNINRPFIFVPQVNIIRAFIFVPQVNINRPFIFVPQVNINRASFNSKINQFIIGHGPFVTYHHRFGLSSHDRCVCGDKSDPNHYATDCPVTKPFHFTKSSAVNLSTWCQNIVQNKISLAQLVNIMKILQERRPDIVI
ncbi:hypothetical protein AVEN_29530-1 [Araneus ventricosus]|uniref:Uncharacterized protein n=1 Tax=Araneus ventricosus TaxID=182803 RepID=A0A4Y2S2Y5_ARAVE|nr:hypothetical protein AVEN_29530-1 [Araneus ventricosus]